MRTPTKALSNSEQTLYYRRWADPQSPYVVELETGLADRLLASISDRQLERYEFGGLLIGEYVKAAKPTLRIDDLVWIGHQASGNPLFELTPEERIQFSSTRRDLITPTRTVLGFFRTHARLGPLVLSATDRELLEREFRSAIHVALLIRVNRTPTAAFFVQDQRGGMQTSPAHDEFRFDSRELLRLAQPARRVRSAPARDPHQAPHFTEECRAPVSPSQVRPYTRNAPNTTPATIWRDLLANRSILLPLAISCLTLCLLFTIWAPATASVLFRGPQLRLTATAGGGMVDVHWRAELPDSERIRSATLIVEDGGVTREIRLLPAELKSGAVAYEPLAGHVRFTFVLSFPNSMTITQSTDWVARPRASIASDKA